MSGLQLRARRPEHAVPAVRDVRGRVQAAARAAEAAAAAGLRAVLKSSHTFNLLDARGAISVTERAGYIGRVRALAKGCAEAWLASSGHAS